MPKLDLTRAARIKVAGGEILRLKGPGFDWVRPGDAAFALATGGIETKIQVGSLYYRVHRFDSSAEFIVLQPGVVEYLVVGPGGGGGSGAFAGNGGGSAGDVLAGSLEVTPQNYLALVGAGGVSRGAGVGNSSFAGVIAVLGGRGSGGSGSGTSQGGGGLGGANHSVTFEGFSHPSGFSGGDGFLGASSQAQQIGGGGRGAGGDGGDANRTTLLPGDGGPGIISSIDGIAVEYGRGGGGGSRQTKSGGGAPNGGFAGPGGDGATPGSGGGGGTSAGGAGANGVVIVRYQISAADYFA